MSKFRIIPVIDILNNQVVHAIKGQRKKYKPLKSKITSSIDPAMLIRELSLNYPFKEFYIANLDSIFMKKSNMETLSKIFEIPNIKIMLDPGIMNEREILLYSQLNLNKLIIGLETIESLDIIKNAIEILGENRMIISIDMFQGKVLSNSKELSGQSPLKILTKLSDIGANEIILLDLFRVGQKLGGIPSLYLEIRARFTENILIGGGIRDYSDLEMIKNQNFSGVLIATALYDGSLKIEKLKDLMN